MQEKNEMKKVYGDVEIRALSWKQPYASLMLHGKIETRVWDTKYRGWVLICASKAPYTDSDILRIAGNEQYGRIHTICPKEPKSQAIAIGYLTDSRLMMPFDENSTFVKYREPWVKTDKNGVPVKNKKGEVIIQRLWCHIYENVQAIEPFEWSGTQGWSTLTDELKDKIFLL